MKLHSIQTPIGAAILAEIIAPLHGIESPEGWGLIFWGRCDRATFGQIILSSNAEWIADYSPKSKKAIVIWPAELAGKELAIDTTCVDAVCPRCDGSHYIENGINYLCRDCGRQWRKVRSGNPKGRPPKCAS
jgi:hypothetical protein